MPAVLTHCWATDNLVTGTTSPVATRRDRVVASGNKPGVHGPRAVGPRSVRLGLCDRLAGGLDVDYGAGSLVPRGDRGFLTKVRSLAFGPDRILHVKQQAPSGTADRSSR
jgi:hypothetical protein